MSKNTLVNDFKRLGYEYNRIEFKDIIPLEGEIWLDLITPLYPEIAPGYKISNKNRVYSNNTKRLLSIKVKKHSNGYHQVSLKVVYENCPYSINKSFPMHRLLMSVFCPVDNMENLVINHINGDKTNNDLNNLEWCTIKENTLHAIRTGLEIFKRGEELPYTTVTEKQVRKICDLYITGKYTRQEIADKIGVSKSLVSDILSGCSWNHVTKDYDFSLRPTYRRPKVISLEDMNKLCKYFEDNNNMQDKNITHKDFLKKAINEINLIPLNKKDCFDNSVLLVARALHKREVYNNITCDYNYKCIY